MHARPLTLKSRTTSLSAFCLRNCAHHIITVTSVSLHYSVMPEHLRMHACYTQWRQHECNFGRDAEGIKEQLQGIRKRVPTLLDENTGPI